MRKAEIRKPVFRFLLLTFCAICVFCGAGSSSQQPSATVAKVVAITAEPSHHLVLENDYVRVFDVTVAPHLETDYHQHDRDYLYVTLGDADVQSVRVGEKPVELKMKAGDVGFAKGGFAHKAVNISDTPFHNITIELKKKYSAKVETCSAPRSCSHPIRMGETNIGDTTLLMGNGLVNVYRTELGKGAGVTTSYYCSGGSDHVLIIAVSAVQMNLNGVEESLDAGQLFFAASRELDVEPQDSQRSWIAIRFHDPSAVRAQRFKSPASNSLN